MRYRDRFARVVARKGGVAIIFAALLPVLVGLVAFGTDLGVIAVARSQLQTVSESSALSAGTKLLTAQRLQMGAVATTDVTAAQGSAIDFASRNKVLGTSALLLANPSDTNTGSEDIVVGYLPRPLDATQAIRTDAASLPYSNAVQVLASRSDTHSGKVPGFFSTLLGNKGTSLSAGSTAAILGVSGFQAVDGTTTANCLPIVLDKATYAAMIQGKTTDQYTFTPGNFTYPLASGAPNGVSSGPDGITESKLYPVGNGYPGNWGTIQIGVTDNSTATLGAQIRYGITPAQLATYPGGVIQPDPTTGVIQFGGNPGISAGIKDDLTSIIGKPVRIPIYDPSLSGGNGNNLVYTVVAFAPVRILKVVFQGKNKYVIVQPASPAADPTEVWGGIRNGPVPQQYRLVLIR